VSDGNVAFEKRGRGVCVLLTHVYLLFLSLRLFIVSWLVRKIIIEMSTIHPFQR